MGPSARLGPTAGPARSEGPAAAPHRRWAYAETKEALLGFYIVDVESKEERSASPRTSSRQTPERGLTRSGRSTTSCRPGPRGSDIRPPARPAAINLLFCVGRPRCSRPWANTGHRVPREENNNGRVCNAEAAVWTGRVLSALVVVFLLFDGIIKFMNIQPVTDAFAELGYPVKYAVLIGVIDVACAILFAIPRTAMLGAVLMTGLLGGAISTHVRIESPLFSHTLFGVYLGSLRGWAVLARAARARAPSATLVMPCCTRSSAITRKTS